MKKVFSIILTLLVVFALASCSFFQDVKSISFSNAPESSYELNEKVKANQFTISAEVSDGKTEEIGLTDDRLTVQGLNGEYIDTKTAGVHTIKVSYNGVTISFKYTVEGSTVLLDNWQKDEVGTFVYYEAVTPVEGVYTITSAGQLAALAKVTFDANSKVVLGADIDLSAHEWTPFNFNGTFDGQGHKISGLKITSNSYNYKHSGLGLFAEAKGTIKNLTLESPVLDMIKNAKGEIATAATADDFKNYGFVCSIAGGLTIDQVDVYDGYINCVGRAGGLIGYNKLGGLTTIKNCYVEAEITGYNPISNAEDDGESDKLGGLIGQSVYGNVVVDSCQVKVVINGTRDLGGLIAFPQLGTFTIKNNKVLDGSVIAASVAGGMDCSKGARYVGGLFGCICNASLVLDNNKVLSEVVISSNNLYEFSNAGKVIGGIRPSTNNSLVLGTAAPVALNMGAASKANQATFLQAMRALLQDINK